MSGGQDQIAACKECFMLFDKDGNGKINVSELGTMVRALGQMPTEAEVQSLIKNVVRDNKFTLTDLVAVMKKLDMERRDVDNELRDSFRVFDRDGSGYISAAELRHVMTNLGEKLTDSEIDEMINEIDVDGDGQVNYEDVVALING